MRFENSIFLNIKKSFFSGYNKCNTLHVHVISSRFREIFRLEFRKIK